MDELHGVFKNADGRTIDVSIEHQSGEEAVFFCEYALHTPEGEGMAAQDQTDDRLRLRVKEDRDPGTESVECYVASRAMILHYTLVVVVDDHEMHEDCVTGGVNTMSWRSTRPAPALPEPVAPGGRTVAREVGGDVSGGGQAENAQV